MSEPERTREVTRLLAELARGAPAAEQLFPLVYEELRDLAAAQLRRERSGHTLQPTALVNEAFLKLAGQSQAQFESRGHFLAIAATAMRRVLVDHAERRASQKRGGDRGRRNLDTAPEPVAQSGADPLDVLDLDAALTRLGALDERKAKVVELRHFAGLSVEEVADVLGSSPATVKRDWEFARVWLLRELKRSPGP